jgi:lipopolysaccharide/colanic/teichoic acid biosynthesis glycosyltransferase
MTRRLTFHLLNFLVLNVVVFCAVYTYFAVSYPSSYILYSVITAYRFVITKIYNFMLVSVLTYVLAYVVGIVKFTVEENIFRLVSYMTELFKFFLILAMVSFIEFFLFYRDRIGRMVYVYIFFLYGIYYYIYRWIRYRKDSRVILWMASAPAPFILDKYLKKAGHVRVFTEETAPIDGSLETDVVYQDGFIDEHTTEALIKSKLAGHTVVDLVELVEKEAGKIPLAYVNIHWFLEKFDIVDRNYFRSSRMFNIFMSILLILLLFLPGLLVVLLHRCFSRGPLFYTQERTGLHGKVFKLYKFRTMVTEAEKGGARFTAKDDPRITRIGSVMRRLRLDEIPQLFNVLKGDMSLVGPRPEREVFIESLTKEIPYYKLRLLVHPGLTGWAQINGVYAGNNLEDHQEKLEYDLYYIKNRSIFLDLTILLRTVKTIIEAKGE